MNKAKEYIERRVKDGQVNNASTARIISRTNDGRHTIELDGGRRMMVFSASGENYNPGDIVSIRYISKDKRQAEIAGRTTRRLATSIKKVWL